MVPYIFKGKFLIPLLKKTLKVIHTYSKYLIFNASSFQWLIICTLLDLFTDYLPNTNIQTSYKYYLIDFSWQCDLVATISS